MANQFHLALAKKGAETLAEWRRTHPRERLDLRGARLDKLDGLDLSGAMLRGANLAGASARGTNFSGADLSSATLRRANLEGADLSRAVLDAASLARANLELANLAEADLGSADLVRCKADGANFSKAILERANLAGASLRACSFRGANCARASLERANLNQARASDCQFKMANLNGATLLGADLQRADLREAWLEGANLSQANLFKAVARRARFRGADLSGALMQGADLRGPDSLTLRAWRTYLYWTSVDAREIEGNPELVGTDLRDADLSGAEICQANIAGACFHGARASNLNFEGARGGHSAWGLESVSFRDHAGVEHVERDALRLESIRRDWRERFPFAWEHIRMFGQLRLFSVSYLALIAIPIIIQAVNYFNSALFAMKQWSADHGTRFLGAEDYLRHMEYMRLGSSTILLFLSVVFISLGVLLYTVFCPPRVKEFSAEQWRHQLNRPLIHYRPLSWKFRWARVPCLIFYTVGAGLFLFVLVYKVAVALATIAQGYVWLLAFAALASVAAMPALDWRCLRIERRQARDD